MQPISTHAVTRRDTANSEVERHVEEGAERADTGVAHQHVDLAERLHRRHELGTGGRIGDVALGRHRAAPQRTDLLDHLPLRARLGSSPPRPRPRGRARSRATPR